MMRLTEEREHAGLSKSKLSQLAGVHVSSLSAIENGRLIAYPGQRAKLAKALKWQGDPDELFTDDEKGGA